MTQRKAPLQRYRNVEFWLLVQIGGDSKRPLNLHLGEQLRKSDRPRPCLQLSSFAQDREDASLYPMLGLFGIFGRSHDLKRLDQALLGVGLHPRLVPEAVKLTTIKLLGEAGVGSDSASSAAAAELLGYCVLGAQGFTEHNDRNLTDAVEGRLAVALEAGDNLDARIVLLTLHAGIIQPSVVEHYGLRIG